MVDWVLVVHVICSLLITLRMQTNVLVDFILSQYLPYLCCGVSI